MTPIEDTQLLVQMEFGSHVYGTSTPTSDRDFKGIFLPAAPDILLQRVTDTINHSTKTDASKANTPSDTDTELFSLQKYLALLLDGQTIAIDMLFTPRSHYLGSPHPIWEEILREKKRFLHSGVSAYARYCRQQAIKYGVKGARLEALQKTLELLSQLSDRVKLGAEEATIRAFVDAHTLPGEDSGFIRIITIAEKERTNPGVYLEVCGRKVPLEATVKFARGIFQKAHDEFGERARLAEKNQGVDWKALMHAVRVAAEAKELLTTGEVTFPRPERDLLLKIRRGELPYDEVAEKIEEGVAVLAGLRSNLPLKPDMAFAEQLVLKSYQAVVKAYTLR